MKQNPETRSVIAGNARRITELNERMHDAAQRSDSNPEARAEWSKARAEFDSQYDALAFPGGYRAGLKRIQAGDGRAIEDALTFLEVRPYFFRSQYMRTKLARLLKRATLTARQLERFQSAMERRQR